MTSRSALSSFSRRDMLLASGVALGWSALGPTAARMHAAEPASEPKIKKAVKIGMVDVPGSLLDKFKVLKKLGYDGIELDSPNNLSRDEVLKARDESGLPVHGVVDSVHWNKRLSDPDPAVRAEGVMALKTAVADSKAYGGTSVLLVPGRCTADAIYDECWKRSQEEIKKVIPFAEDHGIMILMENVWNDFLTTPQETARFIDELESEMVGAYFDVGNTVRYAPPASWVPVLGNRIKKLDIKEYSLTKARKQKSLYAGFDVPLTEGECDWQAVMAELKKINYSGWGTAEVPGGNETYLGDLAKRMDKAFNS